MNYLLTVKGKDESGLVETLAARIEKMGGSWNESRLCRLGGQFAGIVAVSFERGPELPEKVGTLHCQWDPVVEATSQEPGKLVEIRLVAADRPGIVRHISKVLASQGANIEEVESRITSAPFSGDRMFEATYRVNVDSVSDHTKLQANLEGLAEELMCDLEYLTN